MTCKEMVTEFHKLNGSVINGKNNGPEVAVLRTRLIIEEFAETYAALHENNVVEVLEADNGTAALEVIRRYHPMVVLLDVMMPGELDGLDVLDAIKADPASKDTVVGMVTARGQQSDSDQARKRGADAYFIKPFSPLQVVSWVREHMP